MKLKLMYVVPHLSTGGMPQFVLKRIESLQKFKNEIEIYLVEYSQFSTIYLVQRNKIIELLGKNHFFSLGSFTEKERKIELIDIIKKNNIDIVHFEEVPEGFESFNRVPLNVLNEIYNNSRTYKIVESCHNIWYDANNNKNFEPDYYCFVTPYHLDNLYNKKQSPKKVITYPLEDKVSYLYHKNKISKSEHKVPLIEKLNCREELGLDLTKTHILNVGLWTEGKNQKECIEVARILEKTHPNLQFHFVGNRAENFEYYWGPLIQNLPSNVTIWGERNDVEKFMIASDVLMFNSLIECNPLVVRESISYGLKILTRNLSQYMGMFDNYITEIEFNDYNDISNKLLELVDSKKTYTIKEEEGFGNQLFKFYNKVMDSEFVENQKLEKNYRVNQHFVVNPFIEIVGESESKFEITFYDEKNNIIYNNNLEINSWVKLNREYFTKWRTEIKENGDIVYSNILNLENKRVYISFGSKSLGDTLAWMPYCEEFRKKHNCELIVSTFLNSLFVDQYPEIEFVEPGKTVYNIYAQYQLGWFYNENEEFNQNRHPNDFKLQPLQKTATDILGLNYEEIRPKLNISEVSKKKKVGIGFHSTAQAKYWNNKNGWQEVVDYLNSCGYECMIYSKEGNGYMGNNYPKGVKVYKGGSLQEVINEFATCEFFVGLGSGLSWLAWACELPVVLISGFSEKWAETKLDTYRVINENVCHGCFNWDRLDAGDWNWCPKYKGTNRQFECSKQITSEMVINEINNIMNKEEKSVEIDEVTFDWGKGISDSNYTVKNDKLFNSIKGMQNEMESITFKKFIDLYGIHKIDFLKTDCEGGEYDIFTDENYEFIKNNVKKIAGEWHLNENYYEGSKKKFRNLETITLKIFQITKFFRLTVLT
jgi:autotransporter strand-loop-strand O-heptosyltransferase